MNNQDQHQPELFSTSPQSSAVPREQYLEAVSGVARWSEKHGCKGILVYADNSLVDPWLVSQIILQSTDHLCPLVAVQPVYMHPYAVAKLVSSLGHLYGRRIYLNMVAGGFKNDLAALNDSTPHDLRYTRLIEYTTIVKQLTTSASPVSYRGEFYTVTRLKLEPPLPPELAPGIFVSGSSEAGLAAAHALGATAVQYPKPITECEEAPPDDEIDYGIRVGIVARASADDAWNIVHERFPDDRKGELKHQLAMTTSDSFWHAQLSETAKRTRDGNSAYWMAPFETYKSFCPYLVGNYEQVGDELAKYLKFGFRKIILDIPPDEQEFHHIRIAFDHALRTAQCTNSYRTA